MQVRVEPQGAAFFCSLQSRDFEEKPLGSAPRADVWFMLEYGGRWGSKAFAESGISEEIKARVNQQLEGIPNSRLLLIKQGRGQKDGIVFFAALPHREPAELYRFEFEDYAELPALDLAALGRGDEQFAGVRSTEPLILVCTNGLRDKCCARNGAPAFQSLSAEFGDLIWQSTHHGGHRFSANMLFMPEGLSYGRMDLGEGSETVAALLRAEMPLQNLRGRSSYEKIEQAAEGLLREHSSLRDLQALRLIESRAISEGEWRVRFGEQSNGKEHEVDVQRVETGQVAYASCIGDKQVPMVEYELLEHRII